MRRFRRKYYDLFSHCDDRFIALHATDKQGVLRTVLAERTASLPLRSSTTEKTYYATWFIFI